MPEDDQPERVWDEYDWERFLQQQDRKTEKYMELLERYIDDPNRDQIIAREMGWSHLAGQAGQEWAEYVDNQFLEEAAAAAAEETEDEEAEDDEEFEAHPLYRSAVNLTISIDHYLEQGGERLQSHPSAVALSTNVAVAGAKLAAALSDDDIDEIGMTIAYLKRALRAVTLGLEAAGRLSKEGLIKTADFGDLNSHLFHVRDGIVRMMGEYRSEWRRRYEH